MPPTPHPLATLSQILHNPSCSDGLPKEIESDLRTAACMLIQEAGIMLDLPQSTIATAQVLLHRFYYVSSMLSFGITDISITSLYLSSKLCETPIRLRDLINAYMFLLARIKHLLALPADQPLGFSFEPPGFHDEVFWDWKDIIVSSEMQILKRLGFNMQVDLPYSHVINYCRILDLVFEKDVAQSCWSILNDALLTPSYVYHPPHTLACASILLTTRLLRIPLPDNWWVLFDANHEDIWQCCGTIANLWREWGMEPHTGLIHGERRDRRKVEDKWRRTWVLLESKKAVRRWVEENDQNT
ncbi:hypothetical protein TREMEDRAFT_33679 [Tremella mesenterica DSM 1558]|uniref:uncharacterized protein n=1 Tax=Tremella mesenterica (strain ATCC 24925 / CBS 8224 / DSM 1558 / NBRC 9311 / NRRL Y-6157 / RJB 2259-6 / UBC 559-6) TaxID=578456 RepID=UPI0003F4A275|nr:uncharacterized protein TREMEDRAFT_33679 [Tremella mesenterica DSM 1558]EIW67383.1 hypothetical protein TREMEDRAFT_33679 [Tremella mesenterica DSM 1558]